jgi:hypothetical protein
MFEDAVLTSYYYYYYHHYYHHHHHHNYHHHYHHHHHHHHHRCVMLSFLLPLTLNVPWWHSPKLTFYSPLYLPSHYGGHLVGDR